jgi:hypothetical protein
MTVNSDGSFSAKAFLMGSKTPVLDTWTGKFDSNLGVILVIPGRARCKGQGRTYTRTLSGKVNEKKGKYELHMEGDDVPCPDLQCSFKERIQVRKK